MAESWELAAFVLGSFAAGLAVFVGLSGVSRLVLGRGHKRGAAVLVLLAYFWSEATRTVVFGSHLPDALGPADLLYRIVAGGCTGVAVFGLASLIINSASTYRSEYSYLMATRKRIEDTLGSSPGQSERHRERLVRGTQSLLADAVRGLLGRQATGAESPVPAVMELVESTVRPLSRELEETSFAVVDVPLTTMRTRASVRRALELAITVSPFDGRPIVVLGFFLGFGEALLGSTFASPWLGLAWLLAILAWIAGALAIAKRFIGSRLGSWPMGLRVVVVVGINAVVMVVALVIDSMIRDSVASFEVLYWGLIAILLPFSTALWGGLQLARAELLQQLRTSNRQLARASERLAAFLWSEQRSLARAIHRDVQSAAIAAAWRYQLAIADGEDPFVARERLVHTIQQAISSLAARPSVPAMDDVIRNTQASWEGICGLEVRIAPGAMRELDNDSSTRRVVTELLAEFMMNAVKHGQATHARADLHELEDGVLELVFENDGRHFDEDAHDGLGLKFAASEALNLSMTNIGDHGVMIRVTLAPAA
jgi:signal transduction histidine kinase